MHVLFLSDNFPPETNAPASRLHEHARRWVAAGCRVTVVTCAPNFPRGEVHAGYRNAWYRREVVDGIEVVRVKTFIVANRGFVLRTLDYLSFMVAGFVAGLFQRRPDVVVATSPQFFAAVGGWALAAVRRVPFVFELRDLWPASVTAVGAMQPSRALRMLEKLELFLYRRAAAVICVTEAFKSDLERRGIPAEKVHVVTNGVDLAQYRPSERDAALARELGLEGRFVVGYLGTHGMAHALERVLEAAELLQARASNVHFLFVGDGAARAELVASAQRRGLTNVTFRESLPKERMPAAWSLCDVALVHLRDTPVFATVIPSKIFEAMGMGLPIVLACPAGEATGIVERTGAGFVLPPEDPTALAALVSRLSARPDERLAAAEASLAAAPLFSRDHLARAMLDRLVAVAPNAPRVDLAAPAAAAPELPAPEPAPSSRSVAEEGALVRPREKAAV